LTFCGVPNGTRNDHCDYEYTIKKPKILKKQYKTSQFGEIIKNNSVIVFDDIGDTSFQELATYSIIDAKLLFEATNWVSKGIRVRKEEKKFPNLKYELTWYSCQELKSNAPNKRIYKLYCSFQPLFNGWSSIIVIELTNNAANEKTEYQEFLKGAKMGCLRYLGDEYG